MSTVFRPLVDPRAIERLQQIRAQWEEEVLAPLLKRKPERSGAFVTRSGVEVKGVYTPEDVAHLDYEEQVGFPGAYPFTRGIYPNMYRGKLWTMRQYAGWGTAKQTNERFRYLLEQGQTGLSVAFDLPTQLGMDSDDERGEGEVGKVGVAVDTLADMEAIFEGIDLSRVSTSFTINATAPIILAMYLAVGEKQGVSYDKLQGTVQNDILKEFGSRGLWIFPIRPSVKLAVDCIEYCTRHARKFHPISIASHYRDAGANPAEEAAYTLAAAKAYVEETMARGLSPDDFASRLSFFFYTYTNFFEEVAKYRAARRLWARWMREVAKAQDPESWKLRAACVCGGHSLTKQEPLNNIARTTIECMAVTMAGLQSVFVAAYDEAFAIPTELAAKTALRVQQIIAYETDIPYTADPLAGSYFVESLTDAMEKAIRQVLDQIDDHGGMIEALEQGYIQQRIAQRAYEHEQNVKAGKRKIVGVNLYPAKEEEVQVFSVDPEVERAQIRRLREVREQRDRAAVEKALAELKRRAEADENLLPAIVEAVKQYATVGEIGSALRDVYGEYVPPTIY